MSDLSDVSAETPSSAHQRRRGFAGYAWSTLAAATLFCALAGWSLWLTREVSSLKERRIVAVSLSAMVNDFVMAEARSGNTPEQVEQDTRAFMGLLQRVLAARAARGETILVGEAVVGGSVPDVTSAIRAEVGKAMTASNSGSPAGEPIHGAAVPSNGANGIGTR